MKIEVHSPSIKRKEMDAVLTVLVEEKIGPGEQSQRLIQTAKDHFSFDYCLALRSPVTALSLALAVMRDAAGGGGEAAGGRGVLVSALSPRYYAPVIADAGLTPVFCDVDPASALVTPETIRAALAALETAGGSAVCIVVHQTLGLLPDMPAICELGLPVIEDCSLSYGSLLAERKAGSFGELSILGLEERDMLTAGGGALLFAMERRNASVLRRFAALPPEYGLPDMNAAMALIQLREAARNAEKRAEIGRLYTDAALRAGRHRLLAHTDASVYNHYAFPLALENGAKEVYAYAKKKEIGVENAFENTLASDNILPEAGCIHAKSLAMRTVRFPLYSRIDKSSAERVAKLIQTLP